MEIVEDKDEGVYVLSYPDLPRCMTCSDSLDDLLELAKDAKETWILGMLEDEKEIPLPSYLQSYSGQFKLRIPKSLHRSLVLCQEKGLIK
ncbi:MAG: type II toxin-antitoxin system HicB family antitoxin [Holdemanella biformis]|nr:type II toxin-antitoxin system HicB family antitoxin [Holdemanella biformis]